MLPAFVLPSMVITRPVLACNPTDLWACGPKTLIPWSTATDCHLLARKTNIDDHMLAR